MSHTTKQVLGQKGERMAARFLEQQGHSVLFRNFRFGKSELDIISKEADVLVISEVKSFFEAPLGPPEFRVHKTKQKMIIKGAYGFLSRFPEYEGNDMRFDVLIVDFSRYPAQITWHKAAFWDEQGWGD